MTYKELNAIVKAEYDENPAEYSYKILLEAFYIGVGLPQGEPENDEIEENDYDIEDGSEEVVVEMVGYAKSCIKTYDGLKDKEINKIKSGSSSQDFPLGDGSKYYFKTR